MLEHAVLGAIARSDEAVSSRVAALVRAWVTLPGLVCKCCVEQPVPVYFLEV